ncbi:MAG TPA: hypothetical protein VKK79_07850 [Candidatus Lokiarchaeia archaeon]|nr:hypothetical protein [Candidatus Lokiarchaeia archaeon]
MSVQEKERPNKRKVAEPDEEIGEEKLLEQEEVEEETEELNLTRVELSELERAILDIAEEILKLKRYEAKLEVDREETLAPLADKLFATCIARLTHAKGYSKSEIFLTLKELEQKNWIVTGQRRTRQEILESEIMQGILQLIEDSPGIHARDPIIQERLGITRNPFTKHVVTLASFNLIRIEKLGKTQNYFPLSSPVELDELFVVLQNDLCFQMVQMLAETPGVGVLDLARELGVFHGAIQYHVKKLKSLGLLNENLQVNVELAQQYNQYAKIRQLNLANLV